MGRKEENAKMIYSLVSKLRITSISIIVKKKCALEYIGANGYSYPLSKMVNDPEVRFNGTMCLWKKVDGT